ncbi:DUF5780 domain-containing protein [Bacillus marasmi]|uniref:DUF5780 domain-containing protein n=1 Tax=Bacillus marasmi TaxID=1926279 RepID=UPI0011CBC7DD|nr:DUF5780 domain-containing protein [Bacillus marasmi]
MSKVKSFGKKILIGIGSIFILFIVIGLLTAEDDTEKATSDEKASSKKTEAVATEAKTEAKEETAPVEEVKDQTDVLITAINTSKDIIGEDTVTLVVQNNTDKVLKNITVGITGYDADGFPIKLNFGYDDVYGGKAENVNLQPGQSKDYSWTVYSKEHNLAKAKACINTYEFYDVAEQENAFFSTWRTQNANNPY